MKCDLGNVCRQRRKTFYFGFTRVRIEQVANAKCIPKSPQPGGLRCFSAYQTRYHVSWCVVKWEVCAVFSRNYFCLDAAAYMFYSTCSGTQFGQDVPYALAASRKHVIWLPSGCSLAFMHGQLRDMLCFFIRAGIDEMRCVECRLLL